ncbi:MAG TPA: cell division protein, partial [Methanomicrobiales archaeon]|nr:cell division protein [Methanomicrobiales archaeon]
MRVFFVGFGQTGGKIVDMFLEQDKKLPAQSFRGIAVNTARTDLMGLKQIPIKDRILIGQTVVKGHGVGTDNVAGAKITADEIDSIINAIDTRGTHDVDAFVIAAGLGGGTGSGGTPVLARHLKRIYREPVYTLGILPAPEEGRLYSYNAARSLQTLAHEADNTFLFDNSAWKNEGESVKSSYQRINDEIVRRAMLGRLTLPCDYSSAERALLLIAGPPTEFDRKGVEKAKSWVEENISGVEVRGGDYPVDSSYIAAVVVLATVRQ